MDHVKALGYSIELPDQGSGSEVPQPEPLGGNIEQCVAVSLVNCERHDGVILLEHRLVTQLLEVV